MLELCTLTCIYCSFYNLKKLKINGRDRMIDNTEVNIIYRQSFTSPLIFL